ncbi:MAG: hypothetical protein ABIP36_01390 [Acidimicrobiales bacterium]
MSNSASVGIAAFVVDRFGPRSVEVDTAPRVRGASVVKPLLFWVGAGAEPFATDPDGWEAIARPSVTVSDNDATAVLWSGVGEHGLLTELTDRAGVVWTTAGDGEHPALRLLVTAGELGQAYARLASDESRAAVLVRRWMRDVPTAQTFGLRKVAAETTGCSEGSVGVKCGWFGLQRAHAVVLVELGERTLGAAVTTARRVDPSDQARAQELSGDVSRLALAHNEVAGESIRHSTRRALERAAEL